MGIWVAITNYALGARGVDAVSKQDGADPAVVGYPIYDAHGNRVATLVKSGTSFSLTDVRSYDAWGAVRSGAQTGRPRARYCASLGHAQDDESNLIYMRARYYEPGSGRFVSEDPGRDGANWFAYARNDPADNVDYSGKTPSWLGAYLLLDLVSEIGAYLSAQALIGSLAEYGGWTAAGIGWAGLYVGFVSLAIYSGLSTGAQLVQACVSGSYAAALNGKADRILQLADQLKACPAVAMLGHSIELAAWMGIVDGGED